MTTIDLFAGAGGLSLGLEKAGFEHILLNEIDKDAAKTLKVNRKNWLVINDDIKNIQLKEYFGSIDLVTGGIPCQSFSYAGKRLGLNDTRGTLFYEFGRILEEVNPKMFLLENVKGLLTHDKGNTLKTMISVFEDIGYIVLEPRLLKAIYYNVPQKRERVFLVGIRKDIYKDGFIWPEGDLDNIKTVKDAFFKGDLYDSDVPVSDGQSYSKNKLDVMKLVPEGGNWKNLPLDVQKSYMKGAFNSTGGRTGIAKRLSFSEPCLTILCSPSQKQTERCHPIENRPLTIRESARIQTFPDDWIFSGSISSQYKQIGNAVPVNLSYEIGIKLVDYLNSL